MKHYARKGSKTSMFFPFLVFWLNAVIANSAFVPVQKVQTFNFEIRVVRYDKIPKPIPNAKVVVFYNGNSFDKTTDGKGIAILELPINVKGMLIDINVSASGYYQNSSKLSAKSPQEIALHPIIPLKSDSTNQRVEDKKLTTPEKTNYFTVTVRDRDTNSPLEAVQLSISANIGPDEPPFLQSKITGTDGIAVFQYSSKYSNKLARLRTTKSGYSDDERTITLSGEIQIFLKSITSSSGILDTAIAIKDDCTNPLLPSDIKLVEAITSDYASKIRDLPPAASVYQKKLTVLAEKFYGDPCYAKQAPKSVALMYRLYAASLLFGSNSSEISVIKSCLLWLNRSLELDNDFKDVKELEEAIQFYRKIVEHKISSVDLETTLEHNFRIAMVNASSEDVIRRVEESLKIVREHLAPKNEDSAELNEKQAAAIELGFAMGSKLALVALPTGLKEQSFAGIRYSSTDLISLLSKLGINQAETNGILKGVQSAVADDNPLTGASKLLEVQNRLKALLAGSSQPELMRVNRIGFVLGHTLETAAIMTRGKPTEKNINTFVALTQKWRASMPEDIAQCGLPSEIKDIIRKTDIQVNTIDDLNKLIDASREVLRIARERKANLRRE